MLATYAIIIDGNGNASERKLAHTRAGRLLTDSLTTLSSKEYDSLDTREIRLLRSMKPLVAKDYFSFELIKYSSQSLIEIPIIYAFGETERLTYHGTNFRGVTTIKLFPTNVSFS